MSAMGAVTAGAACTAASRNGSFQMHVPTVPDSPAFGYGAVGVISAAVAAFDWCIRLGKRSYGLKFLIAVFADIFVDRHSLVAGYWLSVAGSSMFPSASHIVLSIDLYRLLYPYISFF